MTSAEGYQPQPPFNLKALVREVCATSRTADPPTLAIEVGERIEQGQERAALAQALPVIVQHVLSRDRFASEPMTIESEPGAPRVQADGPSRKVAGIRDWWRQQLEARINIGPKPADWKFLGDCSTVELAYAAKIRENHAARNLERAQWLRKMGALLAEHKVETVRELPETVLRKVLGGKP